MTKSLKRGDAPVAGRLLTYYQLTKPGIIRGNALVAIAGFLLASGRHIDGARLIALLVGLSLVIASACVFNNYLDRHIDAAMARTRRRALVTGAVSARAALIYATVLGIAGAATLFIGATALAAWLALTAMFIYVVPYGIGKRRTVHGTLIGAIPGALPPVIGYTAVTGQLDLAAALLFVILVFWQMPHFYAIAMYRRDDYAAAKLPVLPLVVGFPKTKLAILAYITGFIVVGLLPSIFHITGLTYAAVVLLLGLTWLGRGWQGLRTGDNTRWAKGMFGYSLLVVLGWSLVISLNAVLP